MRPASGPTNGCDMIGSLNITTSTVGHRSCLDALQDGDAHVKYQQRVDIPCQGPILTNTCHASGYTHHNPGMDCTVYEDISDVVPPLPLHRIAQWSRVVAPAYLEGAIHVFIGPHACSPVMQCHSRQLRHRAPSLISRSREHMAGTETRELENAGVGCA